MRASSSLTAVVGFAFFVAMGPARIASAGNASVAPTNTKDGLAIKSFPGRLVRFQTTDERLQPLLPSVERRYLSIFDRRKSSTI